MSSQEDPEAERSLLRKVGYFVFSGLDWLGFVDDDVMLIRDGVRFLGALIAWIVGLFVSLFDW